MCILYDLNCVHRWSLIQTIFETLKMTFFISDGILAKTSLKKVTALVLCLNTVSMVFNRPALIVSNSSTWRKNIRISFVQSLDREPSSWTCQGLSLCSSPPVGSHSSKERRHQSPCRTWQFCFVMMGWTTGHSKNNLDHFL